jgi:hypothetical protein
LEKLLDRSALEKQEGAGGGEEEGGAPGDELFAAFKVSGSQPVLLILTSAHLPAFIQQLEQEQAQSQEVQHALHSCHGCLTGG